MGAGTHEHAQSHNRPKRRDTRRVSVSRSTGEFQGVEGGRLNIFWHPSVFSFPPSFWACQFGPEVSIGPLTLLHNHDTKQKTLRMFDWTLLMLVFGSVQRYIYFPEGVFLMNSGNRETHNRILAFPVVSSFFLYSCRFNYIYLRLFVTQPKLHPHILGLGFCRVVM